MKRNYTMPKFHPAEQSTDEKKIMMPEHKSQSQLCDKQHRAVLLYSDPTKRKIRTRLLRYRHIQLM